MPVIWVHVLVKPAQGVVIVVSCPDCEVDDTKELKGFPEGPSTLCTDVGKHCRGVLLADLAGFLLIAVYQILEGIDTCEDRFQEYLSIFSSVPFRQSCLDFILPCLEPKPDGGLIVRADVADSAALMDIMGGFYSFPFLFGVDKRDVPDGACKDNLFTWEDNRILLLHHLRKDGCASHLVRSSFAGKTFVQVRNPGLFRCFYEGMVLFLKQIGPEGIKSLIHSIIVFMFLFSNGSVSSLGGISVSKPGRYSRLTIGYFAPAVLW